MDINSLIAHLDKNDLTYEATALVAWELGNVDNIEDVANFMYRGGRWPPQNSIQKPRRIKLSEGDHRPEKKYWNYVKSEMVSFLCEDDEKYKELWEKLDSLNDKATPTIVATISAYMGDKLGFNTTLISGFVAVCLYGLVKIKKEALCKYLKDA